uniref:P0076O17.2 protein n=1 Tax=Oryza sativa subsp. japonica TaxID=39947 RepID=Q7X801_ORYSJ|nr:P0076O17.2 [Oryza sativa Japonica Group]
MAPPISKLLSQGRPIAPVWSHLLYARMNFPQESVLICEYGTVPHRHNPRIASFHNPFYFQTHRRHMSGFQGFSNPFPKFSTNNGVCGIFGIRAQRARIPSRIGWSYTEEGRRRAATTEFGWRQRRAYGEQRRRSGRRQLATGRLLALLPRAKERRGSEEGEREMHYRAETDVVTSGRRRGSELSGLGPGKGKETAPGVPHQLLARTPASPARAVEEGGEDGGSKAAKARWWRGNEREGDGAARFNRWQCRFREKEPTLAVKESELAVIDACSQDGDR